MNALRTLGAAIVGFVELFCLAIEMIAGIIGILLVCAWLACVDAGRKRIAWWRR